MSEQATKSPLFAGVPLILGLSNEQKLADLCPAEFRNINNMWSVYANQILASGATITNWKWKSGDQAERRHQRECFRALLTRSALQFNKRQAVTCWMLSEMLTEVPEYLPSS